jgi:hypothetical protein
MRGAGQRDDPHLARADGIVRKSLGILRPAPEVALGTDDKRSCSDLRRVEQPAAACLVEAVLDGAKRGAEGRRTMTT